MNTREELTRLAERGLRQGRLDQAIEQYQALAALEPVDWGVVKLLADLLERGGQREAAAAQFVRWADYLFIEGFHSKAAALYKKVLKLETTHEHALWQLAEVSLALQLRADARAALQRVVQLRERRGDAAGVAAAQERLEGLEFAPATSPSILPRPSVIRPVDAIAPAPVAVARPGPAADVAVAMAPAASAPVATTPVTVAPIAAPSAVAAPGTAPLPSAPVLPSPVPVAPMVPPPVVRTPVAASAETVPAPVLPTPVSLPQSVPYATVDVVLPTKTVPVDAAIECTGLDMPVEAVPAAVLEAVPEIATAIDVASAALPRVGDAASFDWADLLGRDVPQASTPLVASTPRVAAAITEAPLAVAEEPRAPADEADVQFVDEPAARAPEAARADEPAVRGDEALLVDDTFAAGTTDAVHIAESQAEVVASDPVADQAPPLEAQLVPEPDEAQASVESAPAQTDAPVVATEDRPAPPPAPTLGSITPDTSLFSRISDLQPAPSAADTAPMPSFSTPRSWLTDSSDTSTRGAEPSPPSYLALFDADAEDQLPRPRWAARKSVSSPPPPPTADVLSTDPPAVEPARDTPPPSDAPVDPATPDSVEEELDLADLLEQLREWDTVLPDPEPRPESSLAGPFSSATQSLSQLVDGLPASPAPSEPAWSPESVLVGPLNSDVQEAALETLFSDLHGHLDGRTIAEQQLAAGRVFLAAGLVSEAARAFERASLEPRTRFAATQALAELHRSRGQLTEAVGWYEHATMAPVPDAAVKRAVLYDLAESLEALGEADRALGVLLDLLSQVEDYRDARARLDRLLRVDAGG